jgi:hypothetical protein
MTETRLCLRRDALRGELLPKLLGRVFHVTSVCSYASILQDREIRVSDGSILTTTQSKISYFRTRGCVCLFDLRNVPEDELEWALMKYYFLNPLHTENRPVFLFLNPIHWDQLIPWTVSKEDEGLKAMVIPHVEAGHKGSIPLSWIESALFVEVEDTGAGFDRNQLINL